jgi:DnaJ-class molecular chaperone
MKCETCGKESGNQGFCDDCWDDYISEFDDELECPECNGKGTTIEGRSCDDCQGTGKIGC